MDNIIPKPCKRHIWLARHQIVSVDNVFGQCDRRSVPYGGHGNQSSDCKSCYHHTSSCMRLRAYWRSQFYSTAIYIMCPAMKIVCTKMEGFSSYKLESFVKFGDEHNCQVVRLQETRIGNRNYIIALVTLKPKAFRVIISFQKTNWTPSQTYMRPTNVWIVGKS